MLNVPQPGAMAASAYSASAIRSRRGVSTAFTTATKKRKCFSTSTAPTTLWSGTTDQIGESSAVPAYTARSAVRHPIQSGWLVSTRRTSSAESPSADRIAAWCSGSSTGNHCAGDR